MKTQKGITLIALIITIIVMLILVGVSVSVALNTGLFKTAQGAAKNTQIASEEETKLSNGTVTIKIDGEDKTFETMDKYIESLKGGNSGEDATAVLQLGDTVSYEQTFTDNWPTVSEWKVLSNRDGKVTLCAFYEAGDEYEPESYDYSSIPSTFSSGNEISLLSNIEAVPSYQEFLVKLLGHTNFIAYGESLEPFEPYLLTQEAIEAIDSLGWNDACILYEGDRSTWEEEGYFEYIVYPCGPYGKDMYEHWAEYDWWVDGEYYCGEIQPGNVGSYLIWATVEDGCKVTVENGKYTLTK